MQLPVIPTDGDIVRALSAIDQNTPNLGQSVLNTLTKIHLVWDNNAVLNKGIVHVIRPTEFFVTIGLQYSGTNYEKTWHVILAQEPVLCDGLIFETKTYGAVCVLHPKTKGPIGYTLPLEERIQQLVTTKLTFITSLSGSKVRDETETTEWIDVPHLYEE